MTDTKNTSKPGSKVAKRVDARKSKAVDIKTSDKASVPVKKTAAKKAPQPRIKGIAPIPDTPGAKKKAPTKLSGPMQAALTTAAEALKDLPAAPAAPTPAKKAPKSTHVKSSVAKKPGSKSEHIAPRGQTKSVAHIDEAGYKPADKKVPAKKAPAKKKHATRGIDRQKLIEALKADAKTPEQQQAALRECFDAVVKDIRAAGGSVEAKVTIGGLVFNYK